MNTRNKGVSGLKWIVLIAAQAYYCCGTLCPIQSSNCSQFGVNCEVKKTEDTHKYLLGFEVKLWSVDSQDHTCIVYDISRTLWPAPPYQYQYVYNCTSLTEGQYNVEVVSLPRSPFSNIKETAIIRVIRRNQGKLLLQSGN
ncbi:hypothetical protein LSH36_52g08043 [Paralvinella palmiformis]|uniref:Uncharacterized protein n=1 Tax=Paralvinella palmiformis TaxID=53620 RepID=A0AAD9K797_9ANNE|nr:hypothetical protein LSH36_52g08043 [Paralvinella palmiformis]